MKYYELEDLISQVKGTLDANEISYINIEWYWDYQGNDLNDTLDGTLSLDYSFEISAISEKI